MVEIAPRLWSREDYHLASETGVFRADERLELLNGEVYQKMSPQSDAHAWGVSLTAQALREAFGSGHHVREEKPIALSPKSELEPDVAVVRGELRLSPLHPTPANLVLVVEVSDTSLEFDRQTKSRLYAAAGLAEYWIVNLRERVLEVRREPFVPMNGEARYQRITFHEVTSSVLPVEPIAGEIEVGDLFPTY